MCNRFLTSVLLSRTTSVPYIFSSFTLRGCAICFKSSDCCYIITISSTYSNRLRKFQEKIPLRWQLLTYTHSDQVQNRSQFCCCPKYSAQKIAHHSKLNPSLDFQDILNYCFQIKFDSRIFNWIQILMMSNFWTTVF